jgi:four helix bundle protein
MSRILRPGRAGFTESLGLLRQEPAASVVLALVDMPNEALRSLTVEAAHGTIALVDRLPRRMAFFKIGGQLFDSGTAQAATYRAADRAQSTRALIAKMKIVEEESDESDFWIDCLFVAKLPSALHADARALQDQFTKSPG